MPFIQINNLTATPANINSGDPVTFDFQVTGDVGAPLLITYTIGAVFHSHFDPSDAGAPKLVTDKSKTLDNSPLDVPFQVKIVKDDPQGAVETITITVFVQDTIGLSSNSKLCRVTVS
jgi:hypothetical protein